MSKNPMSQFVVKKIVPITFGNIDLSFTNSSLAMLITVLIVLSFSCFAVRNCRTIPTRIQSLMEIIYNFVMSTLCDAASPQAKQFFSFVFSLFIFILTANILGMYPYLFSFTSQIVITASFSALVILAVIISGFYRNGLKFLRIFIPSGIPALMGPMVFFIEITSFLSRPISLSLRLFANMLAGHIMLKVFSGFVLNLIYFGGLGIVLALLTLLVNVAITGLEFFVAFMQAYIFMVLTCLYVRDVYDADQH
ncbi:F0F1 ATP synthase subunit A [Candidatus Liberibacter sp.]|uniref:F0F1 ATP synthase subunit A n=1 Tax=Candidatus Liberibacter sp. TaxID=34022 RepID=UPI0015F43F89|nr:F0F1 ATP synthase subunit A [Candidatus Liberibacter sp.]MBA5724485.1 F0F1 ATP synthase subunit A [Candidatus Liberibacter sp.]